MASYPKTLLPLPMRGFGDRKLWEDVLIELERYYRTTRSEKERMWAYTMVAIITLLIDNSANIAAIIREVRKER